MRFGLIVHHTDAEREYAYDRQSHFGKLDMALDAAAINKWTVVDMKNDPEMPNDLKAREPSVAQASIQGEFPS